jgi:plasmid maintenance system antidote protein VapI
VRRQIASTACKLVKNAGADSDLLLNIQTNLVELLRDSDTLVRQNVVDKLGDKIVKHDLLHKINQMLFDE